MKIIRRPAPNNQEYDIVIVHTTNTLTAISHGFTNVPYISFYVKKDQEIDEEEIKAKYLILD